MPTSLCSRSSSTLIAMATMTTITVEGMNEKNEPYLTNSFLACSEEAPSQRVSHLRANENVKEREREREQLICTDREQESYEEEAQRHGEQVRLPDALYDDHELVPLVCLACIDTKELVHYRHKAPNQSSKRIRSESDQSRWSVSLDRDRDRLSTAYVARLR